MVHHVDVRHRLATGQPLRDRHVVDTRILLVQLGQRRLVRMVDREHRRHVDERRERHADDVVEVQHISRCGGVIDGPRGVIGVLELRPHVVIERPFRVGVSPFDAARQPRLAVGIDRDVVAARMELAGEVRDEQLRSAVSHAEESR